MYMVPITRGICQPREHFLVIDKNEVPKTVRKAVQYTTEDLGKRLLAIAQLVEYGSFWSDLYLAYLFYDDQFRRRTTRRVSVRLRKGLVLPPPVPFDPFVISPVFVGGHNPLDHGVHFF
jgi:hypothetical protein